MSYRYICVGHVRRFFSYRRHDIARAQPLLKALADIGVRVWCDKSNIPENGPITAEIRRGLACSKALVALYSASYPLSGPCQQELTIGWIAAQQLKASPYDRVLILNPEPTFEHVPKILSQQHSLVWPSDPVGFAELANKIHKHASGLEGTLPADQSWALPPYYGMVPVQAERFTGRIPELWELHGHLTANRMSIVTGTVGQALAYVQGMGGNGKTLLAREYAIRFGPAYPGGVFWLNA